MFLGWAAMYLNCKSYYSLRYGTFGTEELVKEAALIGATAIALTNINSTCDAWDFIRFCQTDGLKPVVGAEIRNGNTFLYILLAANNKGFTWINKFISDHLLAGKPFPEYAEENPFFDDTWDGFVIYPFGTVKSVRSFFQNERIGVTPYEVNKLLGIDARILNNKYVVRQPVTFKNDIYYSVHRLLRAIDNNVLGSKLSPDTVCHPTERFHSLSQILEAFRGYPGIVTNTYKLVDDCHIEVDFNSDKNKKVFSASPADDRVLLSKLAHDGLKSRYGKANKEASERVKKELEIINNLGFNAYFLITWDIIRYGQSRGFFHVGRGSGANSIVAYCLQITDVDPIGLDLYFERFLNPHRAVPPDFDIDFSWADRDDVIDYVFKRYGKEHVALLGMHPTFQYNAIIRELGKVFGLPKSEIDELAERDYYNGDSRGENFNKDKDDKIKRLILQYGRLLEGFPSNHSIHAGGILISEAPIYTYTPVFMPPKGFTTTQIDMYVAEDIGLYKLDILSQRGLGHIKDCLKLIKQNKRIDINIHEVEKFKKDPKIRDHIRDGNTIGCFYIESPTMRHVLKKLQCETYETLVAASSIIRPGVGRSGMMREYIWRHNNPGKFKYLHPKLEEILHETYGVMVYQEDVIKVAHYWAGLDMAEADLLRRATSFKNRARERIHVLETKFFENCKQFGYAPEVTNEVWRQIESFGSFSFCKAHSASFAVESYQSLYLKTYYPMEFMVAVINNFGGFYSHGNRELYFYELMKTGAKVHPPCVNNSEYLTDIQGADVYVGFVHIKELEQKLAERIVEERYRHGNYNSLENFIDRTGATKDQLDILIRVGALRFTGINKKQLLWQADVLLKKGRSHQAAHVTIFEEPTINFTLPDLPLHALDDAWDEVELLGFPVSNVFDLVDEDPRQYVSAAELKNHVGKDVTILGYHITHKPIRTIKGETMSFGTFIDAERNWIDSVHFPQIHRQVALHAGFYKVTGKVTEEFGVYSIEVTHVEQAGFKSRWKEAVA
ncbi:MAG TPA: DNA polymerase III subunit alpha [Chitinophagaceae bacterium]|nr:DNA polymerase III subunit alpha [Chitinophagaceae bacterium]